MKERLRFDDARVNLRVLSHDRTSGEGVSLSPGKAFIWLWSRRLVLRLRDLPRPLDGGSGRQDRKARILTGRPSRRLAPQRCRALIGIGWVDHTRPVTSCFPGGPKGGDATTVCRDKQ